MININHQSPKPTNKPAHDFNLHICSWNINDAKDSILGHKSSDADFANILSSNDIFCIQETKGEIKIPNYRCFNSLRPESRSGGLCIGIHHDLVKHCRYINTTKYSPDFQAIEISTNLTGLNSNLIIINVYDSPENSSYKAKLIKTGTFKDTLSSLNEFYESLPTNCDVLLLGDFNARTGNLNSISEDDNVRLQSLVDGSFNKTSYPTKPTRNSKDTVINERGRKLIDFATEWNLSIFNGSTIGDITGKWTCMRYNGQSVVDYLLASHKLLHRITALKILDFNEFSDHRPIRCSFKCTTGNTFSNGKTAFNFDAKPLGFRWKTANNESEIRYKESQKAEDITTSLDSIINRSCTTESDVYSLNDSLVNTIMEIAGRSLERKKIPKRKRTGKNSWYDYECRLLKRRVNKLAKRYIKSPTDLESRKMYYEERKRYRSFLKRKKWTFYANLNHEIEEANSINWDSVKKLKFNHGDLDKLDLYDLANFYNFFKELYNKQTLSPNRISDLKSKTSTSPSKHPSDDHDEHDDLLDDLNNEISQEEFEKVKNQYENRFVSSNSTIAGIAENLADNHVYNGGAEKINTELANFLSVTREDIQRVAKKYLTKDARIVLHYLPMEKGAEESENEEK